MIIGCGQLGSRHAQSLARCKPEGTLTLVDPSYSSLAECRKRVLEAGFRGEIREAARSDEFSESFDLLVVSTSSASRASSIEEFASKSCVPHVLLEKLLAPNSKRLEDLYRIVSNISASFWVNCPMPYYPHFREMTDFIQDEKLGKTLYYSVRSKSIGLVTTSVHNLDHFARLAKSNVESITITDDSSLCVSKREGYSEIAGTLIAETENKDVLIMEFDPLDKTLFHKIEIEKGGSSWKFEQHIGKLTAIQDGARTVSKFETPLQSELTGDSFAKLQSGTGPLWSDFRASYEIHRLLLHELDRFVGAGSEVRFT